MKHTDTIAKLIQLGANVTRGGAMTRVRREGIDALIALLTSDALPAWMTRRAA